MTNLVARDQLVSIFERWQRLEEEKAEISEGLKELFAEAKGNGYDAKALRLAFRAKVKADEADPADAELQALVEIYLDNLAERPRARPAPARVEIIEKIPAPDATPAGAVVAAKTSGVAARRDGPPYDDLEIPAILRRVS